MLRWQLKVRRRLDKHVFWAKLVFVSFLAHVVLLFLVLFMYKGSFFAYNVTVSTSLLTSGAPVVFMPFHKKVNKQPIIKKLVARADTKKHIKQKKAAGSTCLKPQKKALTAPKPKKAALSKKSPKKIVAQKKKVVAKKKVQPIKKKTEPKKVLASKVLPKKDQVVRAKVNQKAAQQVAAVQKPAPIYVGRVEMEALHMQQEMMREIGKHWKPPVGLSKDLQCVLKFLVDWKGSVQQAMVEQSSGVLMYDICARTSVAKLQLPEWARGKEFTITFKQ